MNIAKKEHVLNAASRLYLMVLVIGYAADAIPTILN
jgi:hypothetical protein